MVTCKTSGSKAKHTKIVKNQIDLSKNRKINKDELQRFTEALKEFKEPAEEDLVASEIHSGKFRLHPNKDIEEYFAASARWGIAAVPWDIVRPVFLWKLKFTISEFMSFEEKKSENAKPPPTPTKKEGDEKKTIWKAEPVPVNINEAKDFILDRVNEYDGFPFTWQRLCELLSLPKQHYNKCDKFIRALDKVVNVVTSVTEWGVRVTGEWSEPIPDPVSMKIESYFFGKVDEVDDVDMDVATRRPTNKNEVEKKEEPEDAEMPDEETEKPDKEKEEKVEKKEVKVESVDDSNEKEPEAKKIKLEGEHQAEGTSEKSDENEPPAEPEVEEEEEPMETEVKEKETVKEEVDSSVEVKEEIATADGEGNTSEA